MGIGERRAGREQVGAEMTGDLPAWDVRDIDRQVRARDHYLSDRIDPLMRRESLAEARVTELRTCATSLRDSIEVVERAGGDATRLREQLEPLAPQLAAEEQALALLKKELVLVRASKKWADMAHSALHWACFTDPELERFDAQKAAKA